MTTFSNLFAVKTYFCFTAYHIHHLQLGFLPLKNASCEACHRPTSQALKTATNRPLWGRTFIGCGKSSDVFRCLPLQVILSYHWPWHSEFFQKHFLLKKGKEENEFLSVYNKVGCRVVFTHPQKWLMFQSNDWLWPLHCSGKLRKKL